MTVVRVGLFALLVLFSVSGSAMAGCGLTPNVYRTGPDWDNILAEGTGFAVGCDAVGDWQLTTVAVPTQGSQTFTMDLRVAGTGAGGANNGVWEIDACDPTCTQLTTITVPPGSTGTFTDVVSANFTLSAGSHKIRRFCKTGDANGFCGDVDFMQATAVAAGPTISGVVLSNGPTFQVPASGVIDGLTATCSSGSCTGATFALSTAGSCSSVNNTGFSISGSNLSSTATAASNYNIGIAVTLTNATNSGVCFPTALTGVSLPGPVVAVNNARPSAQWSLALNYDFSLPAYSNKANWLGPIGSNSGFQWYHEGNCNVPGQSTPDSRLSMTTDSTISNAQVLDMNWNGPTDYSGGTSCSTQLETYLSTESTDKSSSTDWPIFNHYTEILVRMSKASPTKGAGTEMMGCAEYSTQASRNANGDTSGIGIERDICNTFEDNSSTPYYDIQSILWYGANNFIGDFQVGPPENLGIYHKFGVRVTGDGASNAQACYYLDGAQIGCKQEFQTSSVTINNERSFLTLQLADSPDVLDEYIQYVRVYSCANWQTQECTGTVVTAP